MRRAAVTCFLLAAFSVGWASTAPAQTCGMDPQGWCAAPAGDPCGRHRNAASCKADARCYGMAYQGESLVACRRDSRGFGINCPTVGCTSTPTR